MRKSTLSISALGLALAFAACGSHHDDNPTGSWKVSAPQSVTEKVADAKSAVKTISLDFNAPAEGADGTFVYSADYDVTGVNDSTYTVSAKINGTWAQDTDDHDDYLLSFDRNSLNVSGTDAPGLGAVTDEFLNSLSTFTTIEDVEVSDDGTHLTFETKNPKTEYHFVKK